MTEEERYPVSAWQAAVASGGTLLSYEEWVEENVQDEEDAADPQPVEREYGVRLWATFRGECDVTVKATSFEEAVKLAQLLDHNEYNYTFNDAVEGDQSIQVFGPDDENPDDDDAWEGDGFEVDMRKDGEPFSWDACDIVKDMAKLLGMEHGPQRESAVSSLISRAHRACNKITGGQEG